MFSNSLFPTSSFLIAPNSQNWRHGYCIVFFHLITQLLLYEETKDGAYRTDIEGFVRSYMPGGSVAMTPCGLSFRDKWGPNRYAGNFH